MEQTKTTYAIHEGRTEASPEQVGMDGQRLALLDQHFASLIDSGRLQAASYLVAKDGHIVAHKAMGKLTYQAESASLMPDSIRKLYSITKAITAVAILQLMEAGKLYLNQPVATWIDEFNTPMHQRITIWHLLTHTSGLAGDPGFDLEPYTKPWYEWWTYENKRKSEHWQTSDWLKLVLSGPLRDDPGKQWIYCTAGFAILGEVITRVSGKPFEQYLEEHIIQLLDMNRTFFDVPEPLRAETCFTSQWEEADVLNRTGIDGMPPSGGNGLYSSLDDLWRFARALLNGGATDKGQLLGRRTIDLMRSNQLIQVSSRAWGNYVKHHTYGLGWSLNHDDLCSQGTYSHEGAGRSGLYIDPVEKLAFIFFVPSQQDWVPESLINPRAIVWSALL